MRDLGPPEHTISDSPKAEMTHRHQASRSTVDTYHTFVMARVARSREGCQMHYGRMDVSAHTDLTTCAATPPLG